MKAKTNELTGAALDWAVAKCENSDTSIEHFIAMHSHYAYVHGTFDYSTNWAQGGPIIEREKIQIQWETFDTCDVMVGEWVATYCLMQSEWFQECGPTPLIAAMRCFVCSRLGEEVDIPEELA